ncbi:tautomerase family protein [Corynebacterium lubricantis]|uniref:tautomerase family protein n=1 Tax=Corynebacterium lubricantis TaxID=541095 RepID=UPI00037762D0|nr:tautomerase family protein [Corynebacterium lubricantis]
MPTYTVWSQPTTISAEAKGRIAECITTAHHEEALAPRFLVQVIFNEIAPGSHFIGGKPAPQGQVWVRADIRSGRTKAQKEKLLLRLTSEIADILSIPATEMMVYLNDIPGANMTEYGRLLMEPGEEDAWFAELPADLQEHLHKLEEA